MILIYAWTDMQIINSINIKLNIYQDRQVDLLIFRLSRVSEELIDAVNTNKIFDNVYILELPKFYLERCRKGIKERIEAAFLGGSYRKYFKQELKKLFHEKKYVCFLVAAFWSETLLVIRNLKSREKRPEIIFYEEGLGAYNGIPKWLFRAAPSRGFKAWVRTILYYGISAYTYRKYVTSIFLYKPELSNIDYLEKRQIPLTRRAEEYCCKCGQERKEDEAYKDSEVIYIAEGTDVRLDYPLDNIYQILDAIYAVKPTAGVVVKAHPIMQASELTIDVKKYPNVYVDYRTESIERILMALEIDNKIVLTGNSSSILYMKWLYRKTPYVILLGSKRTRQLKEYSERYVKNYDEGKAYMAENRNELENLLKKIWL